MKLTNYLRDAFVNAVMNDVPKPTISKVEIQELFVKAMPPQVKKIYKDPELRKHLRTCSVYSGDQHHHNIVCGDLSKDDVMREFDNLCAKRVQLHNKLHSLARGCPTVKKLREVAPDLLKYIPSDDPKATKNLPMVFNVMGDLKALGFKGC